MRPRPRAALLLASTVAGLLAGLVGGLVGGCHDELACGPGTIEDADGVCVLDPGVPVPCPRGPALRGGPCHGEQTCGEGTVLVDGLCVVADDNLHADLQEAPEPNDDGASPAGVVTIGAVGTRTIVYGCVEPSGSGELDPDFDRWIVDTSGPATLELTADGVHGLLAAFIVAPEDAPPLLAGWHRDALSVTGDTAHRQVYLPAAGRYALRMTDTRTLILGEAAGGHLACYFTTIRRVATPAAIPLAPPLLAAADAGDVALYRVDAADAGRILGVTIHTGAPLLVPAFVVLRGAERELAAVVRGDGGAAIAGGLDAGETITLVSDMESNRALVPAAYAYDVVDVAARPLPSAGSITLTKRNGMTPAAPWADRDYLYFDVAAADTIVAFDVSASTTSAPPAPLPIDLAIQRRDLFGAAGSLDAVTVVDAFGGNGRAGGFTGQFVKFHAPGRYYVVVQDPHGVAGETYVVSASHATAPATPVVVGTPLAPTALPARRSAFHTLDLTDPIWLEFGVTAADFPAGAATVRLSFYDLAREGWLGGTGPSGNLAPTFTGARGASGAPMGRVMLHDPRDYLVRVEPIGTPGPSPTYALAIANRDVHDFMTITAGTPIVRTGLDEVPGAVGAEPGVRRFLVEGSDGTDLTAVVTPTAGADIDVRRVDADESQRALVDQAGGGGAETLTGTFAAAPTDWIAFEVRNRTAVATNLSLRLDAITPRSYASAAGAIAWSDACSGTGSTTLGANLDDDFIPPRALPWTFPLFGTPVTHYLAAANGFLVLGGAGMGTPTCSFGCYVNQMLPSSVPGQMSDGIVAALWDDYDTITLCEKVTASAVTIQWTGHVYMSTVTAAFQVVLHDDGVIDFVYGSGAAHTTNGASATIGLENPSGQFGHQYSFNTAIVTAGTSRVLTPL